MNQAEYDDRICKNCKYYVKPKDAMNEKTRYCTRIDDNYSEHYMGRFYPPESFGCNEFRKPVGKSS